MISIRPEQKERGQWKVEVRPTETANESERKGETERRVAEMRQRGTRGGESDGKIDNEQKWLA